MIEGLLKAVDDENVSVEGKQGAMFKVPMDSIKDARTIYEWQVGKKR